jgi:hypothetical protein
MIDSNEEDEDLPVDECDVDSAELQEDKLVVVNSEMYHDTQEDDTAGGFSLFSCTVLKDKGPELQSFFRPVAKPRKRGT